MNASWQIKFGMLIHPLYMSQGMKGLKEYTYENKKYIILFGSMIQV